ncbi:MAG: hypothetical protein OEX07_11620 [Gammaproteobacteria bacterium]|nr:hypothetical protein [Gammaproteobacteria bacterium]
MATSNLFYMWSDNAGVSVFVWFLLIIFTLYLARNTAHKLILNSGRSLKYAMRLFSVAINKLENKLEERNRQVILNNGLEAKERLIEREFHRVNSIVKKDLSAYPSLHRKISDMLVRIENDYHDSTDSPPDPPNWIQAVETIAKLPQQSDPVVAKILDGIKDTIEKSQKETLKSYQENSSKRQQLLKNILPENRNLSQTLDEVKSSIVDISERSEFIDKQMEQYEKIRCDNDETVRTLHSSSLTQFFVSGLVLLVAVLGGIVNFSLIALPMSEMVGGTSQLGGVQVSDIAALVIIMLEIAMGLFLLESLRITNLFPVIGSMDDKMRKKMIFITLLILTILATVEASLAYMRDMLAADNQALTQSLIGMSVIEAEFRWIPSMGQMVMGFILPFALSFVAIPLESFVHSLRTVIGLIGIFVLRCSAFLCRLAGNLSYQAGKIIVGIYDIIIFLPLQIEQQISSRNSQPELKNKPEIELNRNLKSESKTKLKNDRKSKTTNASDHLDNTNNALDGLNNVIEGALP